MFMIHLALLRTLSVRISRLLHGIELLLHQLISIVTWKMYTSWRYWCMWSWISAIYSYLYLFYNENGWTNFKNEETSRTYTHRWPSNIKLVANKIDRLIHFVLISDKCTNLWPQFKNQSCLHNLYLPNIDRQEKIPSRVIPERQGYIRTKWHYPVAIILLQ